MYNVVDFRIQSQISRGSLKGTYLKNFENMALI